MIYALLLYFSFAHDATHGRMHREPLISKDMHYVVGLYCMLV